MNVEGPSSTPPRRTRSGVPSSTPPRRTRSGVSGGNDYVELHCHSAYSFLDGASSPEELAQRAAELGYPALALTDHDGVWGAMEFAQACKAFGVRPIVGCELTVTAGAGPVHLTLLVEDATGWRNLCRLTTEAHADTRPHPAREPLPPSIPLDRVERRAEGLVCLSGCARQGALAASYGRAGDRSSARGAAAAAALGRRLVRAFGRDRFRVELQRPYWRHDRARNRWLEGLAERLGVPCVASGNVHAHHLSRAALQDTLVAVRLGGTLEETEPDRRGNGSAHLAEPAAMSARFGEHPRAVAESARIAARLGFDLTRDLGYRYPGSEDPGADRALAEICGGRLDRRYADRDSRRKARRRLDEELQVIRSLRLSGFFLLHFEILELAREVAAEVRGPDSTRRLLPPGRGRGSSVSSIVCYLTGLSHVDPVRNGLFLGRFLNEEITEAPDIDLDFPREVRERLIPRIHERYGEDRSALVAAFACYRSRSATRDFGKVLGLPAGEVERVAKTVDMFDRPDSVDSDMEAAIGADRAASARWQALARLARDAWGLPRHLSQHPGGNGDLHQAVDRYLPGAAGGDGGTPAGPVGQGLVRGRGLLEDRPSGTGNAVGGRALRGRDRPGSWRADRPLADPDGRPEDVPGDPGGGYDRSVPDREQGADADAAEDAAGEPRRPDGPGRAGAPGADPGGAVHPIPGASRAVAGGALVPGSLRPSRRWSRSFATRWGRSSSRSR